MNSETKKRRGRRKAILGSGWLTVADYAKRIGVAIPTVYWQLKSGRVTGGVRVGSQWLIPESAVGAALKLSFASPAVSLHDASVAFDAVRGLVGECVVEQWNLPGCCPSCGQGVPVGWPFGLPEPVGVPPEGELEEAWTHRAGVENQQEIPLTADQAA
jgi:excisionase family DNA binding protein